MSGFNLEGLKKLEDAIAQGVLIVKYSDKSITYRSLDEMLRTRNLMRKSLGLTEQSTRLKARFSKGLDSE